MVSMETGALSLGSVESPTLSLDREMLLQGGFFGINDSLKDAEVAGGEIGELLMVRRTFEDAKFEVLADLLV